MAFERFTPQHRGGLISKPRLSITAHGLIYLSAAAYQSIGSPAAIVLECDADEYLVRVSAVPPGTRGAYRTGGKARTKAIAGKPFLRWVGLPVPDANVRFETRKVSATALVADLSDFPAPKRVAA